MARYLQEITTYPWTVFQLYFDAYQLLWTIVLLMGISLRIRSSFIALTWVVFASIGNLLKSRLFGQWRGKSPIKTFYKRFVGYFVSKMLVFEKGTHFRQFVKLQRTFGGLLHCIFQKLFNSNRKRLVFVLASSKYQGLNV